MGGGEVSPRYILGASSMGIFTSKAERIGDISFASSPFHQPWNQVIPIVILQELRGDIARCPSAFWIWNRLVQPIDRLLVFSDVIGVLPRRNNSDVWGPFWRVMRFPGTMANDPFVVRGRSRAISTLYFPFGIRCPRRYTPFLYFGHQVAQRCRKKIAGTRWLARGVPRRNSLRAHWAFCRIKGSAPYFGL